MNICIPKKPKNHIDIYDRGPTKNCAVIFCMKKPQENCIFVENQFVELFILNLKCLTRLGAELKNGFISEQNHGWNIFIAFYVVQLLLLCIVTWYVIFVKFKSHIGCNTSSVEFSTVSKKSENRKKRSRKLNKLKENPLEAKWIAETSETKV